MRESHSGPRHPGRFHSLRLFLSLQVGWVCLCFAALRFFGVLSVRRLFLLIYIGFLVSFELTSPKIANHASTWWRRLRWIQVLGLIVLAYLLWLDIVRILPDRII